LRCVRTQFYRKILETRIIGDGGLRTDSVRAEAAVEQPPSIRTLQCKAVSWSGRMVQDKSIGVGTGVASDRSDRLRLLDRTRGLPEEYSQGLWLNRMCLFPKTPL
jgi:hypothetical protein